MFFSNNWTGFSSAKLFYLTTNYLSFAAPKLVQEVAVKAEDGREAVGDHPGKRAILACWRWGCNFVLVTCSWITWCSLDVTCQGRGTGGEQWIVKPLKVRCRTEEFETKQRCQIYPNIILIHIVSNAESARVCRTKLHFKRMEMPVRPGSPVDRPWVHLEVTILRSKWLE